MKASERRAERMRVSLNAPCEIGTQRVALSASLGLALFPGDGEDASTLIARADAAMYRAKKRMQGRRR